MEFTDQEKAWLSKLLDDMQVQGSAAQVREVIQMIDSIQAKLASAPTETAVAANGSAKKAKA